MHLYCLYIWNSRASLLSPHFKAYIYICIPSFNGIPISLNNVWRADKTSNPVINSTSTFTHPRGGGFFTYADGLQLQKEQTTLPARPCHVKTLSVFPRYDLPRRMIARNIEWRAIALSVFHLPAAHQAECHPRVIAFRRQKLRTPDN